MNNDPLRALIHSPITHGEPGNEEPVVNKRPVEDPNPLAKKVKDDFEKNRENRLRELENLERRIH